VSNTLPPTLRILVIAHSLVVPSNRARWERLVERHLDADVTLVAPAVFGTDRYGSEQSFRVTGGERGNYRVLPIPTTARGLYRTVTLGMRRARPHVVQVNEEPTEWSLLQSFLAARLLAPDAARFFYQRTNILCPPERWHQKMKLRAVLRLTVGGFVGSSEAEGVLRALGMTGDIHIQTEIGADERAWVPRDDDGQAGTITFGYVGGLLPEKGLADLARAAVRLQESWSFVIAGDGPEPATVKEIVNEAGFKARLDMRGLVERDRLPSVMRELDVLVLPSRTTPTWKEQFGLVLAEAMLSGVAVIGTDSGAIPEVIGDGGLIFPERDLSALTSHLKALMDRPARRAEFARRGRERALRLYSATALADQTYELYRELVARRAAEHATR
jgi:glycosyltransferase involved in cell wall biosynthesis